MLSNDAKELRRLYLKEWRKKHPEKVKQYNREYWERKVSEQKQITEAHEVAINE